MPKTRIHGHDQHLVEIRQNLFNHGSGSRRVNRDSCALAEALDALHRAMQIVVPFPVNEKRIGAGLDKKKKKKVRV